MKQHIEQKKPVGEARKRSLEEAGHMYLKECMEQRVPLLLACHRAKWRIGCIAGIDVYAIRFYDFKTKQGEWVKKLQVKYFFRAAQGISIKDFFTIDEAIKEKGIESARTISERYQISDEFLKEALDERHHVRVTTNEGERFEGLMLLFDQFHIQLELSPDVSIFFFRHGICDFQVIQSKEAMAQRADEKGEETMKRDSVDSKRLAQAVREQREKMSLSQKKLGEHVGLSSGSIGWLESGIVKKLSEENVKKILSYLKIDLSEFMRVEAPGVEKKYESPEQEPIKSVDSRRLAQAVREQREKRGLSQKKLGERFGLSAGFIGLLEHGDIEKVSEVKVKKILSYLKIKLSEFMRVEAPGGEKENGAPEKSLALKDEDRGVSAEVEKELVEPMGKKKKEPSSATVMSRVSAEVYNKIREYGSKKRLTTSEVVREAIERFFAEPEVREKVPAMAEAVPPAEPLVKKEEKKTLYDEEERECLEEILGEDEEEESVSVEEIKMLLKGGHGYGEIGELLGVTAEKVKEVLLGEHRTQREKRRKEIIEGEMKNLDVLQKAIWNKASTGSLSPIELVLKIMGLRAKLMGIDRGGG